ncbi:MAG: LemA family protein [Spirochaetales bacterium]|nr:LemA family protein [Spirochaetales bacterium]
MGLIIALVAIALIAVFFISTYNGFVKLRNKCEESFATMDAYLKKRWDLIPNLVETVKGYASHEKETLERVIQARNMAMGSQNMGELQKNENALAAGLKSVFALSESYPDLKANQGFVTLQNQLQSLENDILQSRKYYNAVVKSFNTKRELFPSSLVAGMMNLEKKEYFEIDDTQRENVKVSF